MDNWFMSVPLVAELKTEHKLTAVGTLRKNKREIPEIFTQTRARPPQSSLFGFSDTATLVSYVQKKYRNVLLLSSMHDNDSIDESSGEARKPEILTLYNITKGGVDTLDFMKGTYSVARISRRWPLVVFFAMLNIGGINSFIIWQANNQNDSTRRAFLKSLTQELCADFLQVRAAKTNLPRELRVKVQKAAGIPNVEPVAVTGNSGRCAFCSWKQKQNRKTRFTCARCKKFMCGEHTGPKLCQECPVGTVEPPEESDSD